MPLNNLGTATGNIKINTSDLKNADIALRSAGRGMLGLGAVAVGAFGAIVGEAAKFEKEMDFVGAITNATGDQMDALSQKALEMGKKSIFGPVALAQSFVELAKAGASIDDIIAGVGEASVALATAADVEVPFAGENLINIMNTFELGADQAMHVADQLAGAANASSVELSDIVATMRYAGPVAHALGLNLEETNQALSILGKVGIKGSQAGTSLRFMMTHLIPQTDKAAEAMRSIGLEIGEDGLVKQFTQADGSLIGLAEAMGILGDATSDLGTQAKVKIINDIFGVRAMPSVLQLIQDGTEGFKTLQEEIERTTAMDVAAERTDNLAGSIAKLKATLSAIMTEAGGPFQETVKGWVDGLRDLLLAFDSLPSPVKTFLITTLLVVGVLSLMSGAFLLTIGNMVRAVRVVGEITNAFALFTRGAQGATAANGALSAGILASPWFWLIVLIVAVIAAIVLLWLKCEAFRNFVKGFWEDIKGWGQAVATFFTNLWGSITDFFSKWDDYWASTKTAVSDAWNSIKSTIGDMASAVGGFFSGLGGDVVGALSKAWGELGSALSSVGGVIGSFFSSLPGLASKAVSAVIGFFQKLPYRLGFILGFIIGRWIRTWLYDIPKFMLEGSIKVIKHLISFGGQAKDWVTGWTVEMSGSFLNWLQGLPMMFKTFFAQIFVFLINWGQGAFAWAVNFGVQFFTSLWTWIQKIPGMVKQFFAETLTWLITHAIDFWNAAVNIGTNLYNGLIDFVRGLPGRIYGLFLDAVNLVKSTITSAYNAAKSFGEGLWNGFKKGLFGSPKTKIEYALMAIDEKLKDTQGNLARSIRSMNGMSASIPISTSAVGLTTPIEANAQQNTLIWQQNGPLVGVANLRDRRDVYTLARDLEDERAKRFRARGLTTSGSK